MTKFSSKPAIRDSFDEEEASDDVDDEVFIRDGRNGYKIDEECGVKKPLMPLRRRHKIANFTPKATLEPRRRCKMFLAPCCYGVAALSILLGLIALSVIIINYVSLPLGRLQLWFGKNSQATNLKLHPCDDFSVSDVWVQSFPKLTSETAVRLNDVNHDGIVDIIIGYGTGTDGRNVPDFVCKLYFGRDPPCLGGILALNGKNGEILWQHWTQRPVFSVDCSADITEDGVNDCLIGGKGGLLHVVNGHDGSLLWHLEDQPEHQQTEVILDVYSAQIIPDVDDDGVVDVLSAHTMSGSSGNAVKGHLLIISGKVGSVLRMIEMPGGSESYFAPQLLVHPDGEKVILIGTGGTASHSWGGLHAVPLSQLAGTDKVPFQTLVTSDSRGVMSPPVLVDINHDGTEDIIVSLFNSTVVAVDGLTYKTLWNFTFPNSQTFSPPTPGYFNEDDVPDFLVKFQNGPDFPLYFFSEMNILDGKTGQPLLEHSVIDSVGSQMGGQSISIEGQGNDWFLYWTANCLGHEGAQTPFSFAKGSDIVAQSQADLCHLRFNSTMITTLFAINRHTDAPGFPIYSSDQREAIEYNNSKEALEEAGRYLASHPDFWNTFGAQESVMKPNNGEVYFGGGVKPVDRQSYESAAYKEDKAEVRVSNVGKTEKAVEAEEPDYTQLMQAHQIGKHQKPHSSLSDSRSWRLQETSKNYGTLYEPRTSDNLEQDYESPLTNIDPSSDQLGSVFSSYLSGGDEQDGRQQAVPSFGGIFQSKHRSGSRRLRSTEVNDGNNRNHNTQGFNRQNVDKEKNNYVKNMSDPQAGVKRGIHPITSTGTLAPPISKSGIDLVFISYWIPPSDSVQILTDRDVECMKQGISQAANDESEKYGNMDPESVELAITAECLYQRLAKASTLDLIPSSDGRLEPHPGFIPKVSRGSPTWNKALNLRLGQLTVYRLNLKCKCRKVHSQKETCAKILPFTKQSWPSFMGHNGRGYYHPK